MEAIRSRDNPRIKHWSRLIADARVRRDLGQAMVEGIHLVEDCLGGGIELECVLVSEEAREREDISRLLKKVSVAAYSVPQALMVRVLDVESPSGIAAVIRIPRSAGNLDEVRSAVYLDGVQDPGNVGAIIRTSAAFGVDTVVLGPGCADPWSPKVLRSGMGGHFHLHVLQTEDLPAAVMRFGGTVLSTVAQGGSNLRECVFHSRIGWVFGNEGSGISPQVEKCCSGKVSIPMLGDTESLNVAACAAICLYEHSRQAA